MTRRKAGLAALLLLALAGCSLPPSQPDALTVHGSLQLPRDVSAAAVAVVELRDVTSDHVLAEQRQPLRHGQSALPFRLHLSPDGLTAGHALGVRAAVLMQGWAQWLSDPVAVDARRGSIDLGTLVLASAQRPLAFQTRIDCRGRSFVIGMAGDVLMLRDGENSYALEPVASAPDERFDVMGDASTFVWVLGRRATVSVGGSVYAGCSVSR